MKKILVLGLLALSTLCYAEDNVFIMPMAAESNSGWSGDVDDPLDYSLSTTINFSNTVDYYAVAFDIYVPTGMEIGLDCEGSTRNVKYKNKWQFDATYTTKTSDLSGYDRYAVAIVNMKSDKLFGGASGEDIALMYFATPALADGVYPIYIKNAQFSDLNNVLYTYDAEKVSTSYLVIGSGTGTLAVDGCIPSVINTELESATAITGLDLTNATSIAELTLKDGVELTKPSTDLTIGSLTYNRTVESGKYASITLPVDVSDGTFYVYDGNGKDSNGGVTFNEQTGLTAGTPAIVTADVAVSLTNAVLKSGATKETITSGYYLKGNTMKSVNGTAVVNPYRASWDLPAGIKGFNLNTADGIKSLSLDEVEGAEIYDLSGRKLNKATKGVNIIGGQKVLRK